VAGLNYNPEMNPRYSVAKSSEDPRYLLVLTSGNEWTRNVSEARTFEDKDEARRHAKEHGAWVIQCAVCDHIQGALTQSPLPPPGSVGREHNPNDDRPACAGVGL